MAENIENIRVEGVTHPVGIRNVFINDKGNFNIITSEEMGNTSRGKINIESMSDIQMKATDDIIMYSHHRAPGKQDEVSIKTTDGEDNPVKLQLQTANITISTKGKDLRNTYPDLSRPSEPTSDSSESEILDVNINTGKETGNKKGYLKVRARAIDLRCEEHGGIALQPKGFDSQGHMNKIKFEHGGGDGLEFGTFNTEHTSLFTDDYRFNRDGIVKMATRDKEVSDKYKESDESTHYKYTKQADDTYDKISDSDEQATWHDIIKTGNAGNYRLIDEFNPETGVKVREMSATGKGHLQITTRSYKTSETDSFNPEIQIKSSGKTTITAGDDIELTSQDQIQFGAREVELSGTENVNFGTTPELIFLTNKVSKKAVYSGDGTKITTGILNNLSKSVWKTSDGKIKVPLDKLYVSSDTLYQPATDSVKTEVFTNSQATTKPSLDRNYFVQNGSDVFLIEINSSFEAKKNPIKCEGTDWENTVFVDSDYSGSEGETEIQPNTLTKGESIDTSDLIKFISWAKTNNFGPWSAE